MNEPALLPIEKTHSFNFEDNISHQITSANAFQKLNQQQLPEDVLGGKYDAFLADPSFCLSLLRKHPEHIWAISPSLFYNFDFISKTIQKVQNVLTYFPIQNNLHNYKLFTTIFKTSPTNIFFLNSQYLRYQELIVIGFDIYFQANPNHPTDNLTKILMKNILSTILKDGLYSHLLPKEFQTDIHSKTNPSVALQHLFIKCHEDIMKKDLGTQLIQANNSLIPLKF